MQPFSDFPHGILQVDITLHWNFFVQYVIVFLGKRDFEVELELVLLFQEVTFISEDGDDSVVNRRPCIYLVDPLEGVFQTFRVCYVAHYNECMLVSVELVQSASDVVAFGVELEESGG